ncbi:gliding motility-associated C-terminal domain-containing protein [Limnovirga soli]|uniref:T9SS type B sorting domain-containing protein n=1 Tax=Limnovirga soli TaxID=2656915 RepID=A0A8J8FDL5_9BACT|nr:gliding motility-associated C-terminal domain-containing protein [Limnovirga soli]NNV53971.1 T9SS type B sorting domain-containing protein [Limnovirga soli]
MSWPYKISIFLTFLLLAQIPAIHAIGQCTVQNGPPPSNQLFNTASNGIGGKLAGALADRNWQVAEDNINGPYLPAIVMSTLPPDYYVSTWTDCSWISINQSGAHGGDHNYFYKMNFDLPCFTPCNKSYNDEGSFCLSLDILCDNSVYEIYVNGIPQSRALGGLFPVNDPYHAVGEKLEGMVSVSLCHNWKAGNNSIVIEVASSGPQTGVLIQASTVFPQNIATYIADTICEGSTYLLGNSNISKPGYSFETIHTSSGCDSTIALNLFIKARATTTINQSICEGGSYLGYNTAGTYTDTFTTINGCDSIRTLHLITESLPKPVLNGNEGFCEGDSLVLSPGDFLSYLWQDGSTQHHFTVKKSGIYSVTVSNACGISSISAEVLAKDCQINFPTAFTPNGDGRNDYFKVLTSYSFEAYHFKVYNRWGQQVFETNTPSVGWDGTINGKLQPAASSYIWYCSYKKAGQTHQLKGTIILIR